MSNTNHTIITENPSSPLSEECFFEKLELSRKHFAEGKIKNADHVISDMRTKLHSFIEYTFDNTDTIL